MIEEGKERPPVGLRPKVLADADIINVRRARVNEICEAIIRYNNAKKTVPTEWTDELCDLLDELQ